MRRGLPPTFKPWRPPKIRKVEFAPRRGSSRDRGYDARWDRLSIEYRSKNPFCRFCEQEGRDGLAAAVDHILPTAEYPEKRYEWDNLQSLCKAHHDVTKQRLENYAREHMQLHKLPLWCADPKKRPVECRGA